MKYAFLIIILLSVSIRDSEGAGVGHAPVSGIMDLRGQSIGPDDIFNLNGEWEFYWEQLLTPDSYSETREQGKGIICKVPSFWSSYQVDGKKLPGDGYGTYALTIILPEEHAGRLCMDIPIFDVAFVFYMNDLLVHQSGTVGTSREEEEPWYDDTRFCFIPRSDTLQLLVQVSNFHHRRGGFWKPMVAGGMHGVLQRAEHQRMYNYSTIGVLFIFTIFFVIFWIFSRENRVMLLFALATMGILVRTLNTGLYYSNYLVDIPWSWQIRMEYTGTYLAQVFGVLFLNSMFPRPFMRPVVRGNTLLGILLLLSVFILPPRVFTYGMLVFQPLILLFVLYYLVMSGMGMIRRKIMDTVLFFSLALFIFALINDIMLANSVVSVNANYINQISFQILILAMAVLIIVQWRDKNKALEQMEESLRFKNKVLSVIAHDLKNPVASVAQFSDLMSAKPELAGKPHILQSLKESSQAAVDLLDNLLYWGRSQAEELRVSPEEINMARMIRDVESLFLHMASQKQLALSTVVEEGASAWADRALTNIVMRNLLSNAIKFTPAKGSVSIKCKRDGNQVRVTIADTGVGIEPTSLKGFMERGQITSSPGTGQEKGTGLGLQLVKDLVEKSGGKLEASSQVGKGSVFSFTLPAENNRTS